MWNPQRRLLSSIHKGGQFSAVTDCCVVGWFLKTPETPGRATTETQKSVKPQKRSHIDRAAWKKTQEHWQKTLVSSDSIKLKPTALRLLGELFIKWSQLEIREGGVMLRFKQFVSWRRLCIDKIWCPISASLAIPEVDISTTQSDSEWFALVHRCMLFIARELNVT